MKSILIKILYVIVIPIIMYDMILITHTLVKPGETPTFLGIKTFTIISNSMNPKINIDDIVIIKEVPEKELKVDDIITFNSNSGTITHRITGIQENGRNRIYITKGDSNSISDVERISYDQIEGKYVGKIPRAGKILGFLKNKYVFGGVLILLIICFCLDRKRINTKEKRKEKRRKYDRQKEIDLE